MIPERQDFEPGGIPLNAAPTPSAVEVPLTAQLRAPQMPAQLTTVRLGLDDLARRLASLEHELRDIEV